MIEVKHLVKQYGDHCAVDDLSFTVQQGQIYGFLGPNGAGKSTTMNIITGCLAATSGDVLIDGHDIVKQPLKAKASIGYLPEQPPLYPDMTPAEYLDFVGELKGLKKKERAAEVDAVMEKTGLLEVRDRLIKNLSKGYKQRVGLAQAILGDPQIVILDEPTVGLDPAQIIEIRNVIKSLAPEHTVIFSSHILSEVSEICNQILIIANGKLIAEDTPENLERHFVAEPVLNVTVGGEAETVAQVLSSIEGVESYELSEQREDGSVDAVITMQDGIDIKAQLSKALAAQGLYVLRLQESKATLEDVFMELISQGIDYDESEVDDDDGDKSDEAYEVDAEALIDGTMQSVYDEHEAFDAPKKEDIEEAGDDDGNL